SPLARDRLDAGRIRRVPDDLVAALHQAARPVAAHPAQPYDPELHAILLLAARLPDELAERVAIGDDDHVGGAEEEARVDDAGDRADPLLETGRILDRARVAVEDHVEVVGHERTLVLHPQGRLEPEVLQAPPAERGRERQDLDRKRAA